MTAIEISFNDYLKSVSSTLIADGSVFDIHKKSLIELFDEFGLDQEQKAQVLSNVFATSIQSMTQIASDSAMKLVITEKEFEKIVAEISLVGKQELMIIEQTKTETANETLVQKKILTEVQNALLVTANTGLTGSQDLKVQEDLKLTTEQILTQVQETALKTEQVLTQAEQTGLITNQALTEVKNALEVIARTTLTNRQEQGYDDNLSVKLIEHQSGLASFAVNADSDSAQSAINTLKALMKALDSRISALTGEYIVEIQVAPPVPDAITEFAVISTQVIVEVQQVPDAEAYNLYRDSVLIGSTVDTGASNTLLYDTTVVPSTSYKYTCSAIANGYESGQGTILEVTTPA